ncbi:polysaccharide deacetylase family protein [Halomonas lysinitropha]|uniref:DUF7033 domain-containing protein n=1 Tax=Halomonas lysinitropha TaxID=2607506 RepID=A0A5K1IA63_9GAMM|nr:polysaccharide deacetylase family protein [Halomonas lysinitropha]VVZ97078.1 hypothetical protein HALO32_03194 [Halomonas lysinitropha]
MTFLVETPVTFAPERDFILEVLFGEFLGLSWRRVSNDRKDISVILGGQPGEIRLPDGLFSSQEADWLTVGSMPESPLSQWDTRDLAQDITLVDPILPVIYGDRSPVAHREGDTIRLPLDIFGSAFFMLSRYEEAVRPDRDVHDRFPATASLAYQAAFLKRPIIDEYVEILWAAMQRLWPGLERKPTKARTRVSCDVDNPFSFTGSLPRTGRRLLGDVLKRRALKLAIRNLRGNWAARRGNHDLDANWNSLDWIMDVNEEAGRSVAFYFIPEPSDPRFDRSTSLDDPRMRGLLRRIHDRGHEIGVHPGYSSYTDPSVMARSVATLRRVLGEMDIEQAQLGGRQHFLRWQTPTTARLWEDNRLDYDSTLGFAEQPGFRCGTCREYPLYDLEARCPLRLRERPLILMECSVIAERYLDLGYSDEALKMMHELRETCYLMRGNFTMLWHNSHFDNEADKKFYLSLL